MHGTDLSTNRRDDKKFFNNQSEVALNSVCRVLESLQPAFVLNYNAVCYEEDLRFLNHSLEQIALEIEEFGRMLLGNKRDVDVMKKIYHELLIELEEYAHSHDRNDFKKAFEKTEKEKPEFTLNYKKFKP